MKNYRIYLFDLDDTLINSINHAHDVLYPLLANETGTRYNGIEALKRNWGRPFKDCLSKIFQGQLNVEQAVTLLAALHERYPAPFYTGVENILKTLKKHNKFIGLYSSGDPRIFDFYIQRINTCFKTPLDFTLNTCGMSKSSAGIVSGAVSKFKAQQGAGVDMKDVMVIGDAVEDFIAARKSGADFTGLLSGGYTNADFIKVGCRAHQIFPSVKNAVTPRSDHGVVAIITNHDGQYLFIEEGRPDNPFFGYWSGPHGQTKPEDILEEETVCRETMEECGLEVSPIEKLYTRAADTKVKTVSFWRARLLNHHIDLGVTNAEVRRIKWVSKKDILNGKIKLYPGTHDFIFNHFERNK